MMDPSGRVAIESKARTRLSARLAEGRAALHVMGDRLPPWDGFFLARATTDLVDEMIQGLAALTRVALFREGLSPEDHRLLDALRIVALGGYGRRELCPRSDVDLLFIVPDFAPLASPSPVSGAGTAGMPVVPLVVDRFVKTVLYALWDMGFEVGHAVRTVQQCVDAAAAEQSILTALLDARDLSDGRDPRLSDVGRAAESSASHADGFADLVQRLDVEFLVGGRAERLIADKLQEVKRRRERFGGSLFLLEPNVKEGEGGLRDLHSALWIARARWRTKDVRELLRIGVLSPIEARSLERAYSFLLRVRAQLHLVSGRRQDILGYEHQEPVARALGYVSPSASQPDARSHGVERFMRAYYFQARQIRAVGERVIERATSHTRRRPSYLQTTRGGFKVWEGTLTVSERDQFERDPAALLRIFRVAQEESLPIYSYTKNLIAECRHLIDRNVRRDASAVSEFLTMLEDPSADGTVFDLMHDLGILRRFIPELARVTARWQRSLYHVYTVDVHSIVVLKNLKDLRNGSLSNDVPELARLMSGLPRPNVLYMAGLLHDVGKGWPKSEHSERGAKVARLVGARFEAAETGGWGAEETADLEWLVKNHLAMSDISQRRDASDLDLVAVFAKDASSVERLSMLYVLTFADMKGTSPKVWTDWKGVLLKELYGNAVALLEQSERGEEVDVEAHIRARRERAERELVREAEESGRGRALSVPVVAGFVEAMPPRYMVSFPARRMLRHFTMWQNVLERGGIDFHVRSMRDEEATELTVACPDRPGLLALFAGTLSAHRFRILSAQVFSLEKPGDGRVALDVIHVRDDGGREADSARRWPLVRRDLEDFVLGGEDVRSFVSARVLGGGGRLLRPRPIVRTEVYLSNSVSKTETVIDVFCQDQLGVLYTIARVLADEGLTISLAKISTQGDRVADGFYVTDATTRHKIEDPKRLQKIKRALEETLRPPETETRGAGATEP
ncbi:MAG: [protein-PII] uridylyltransferase [Deltaproteobacteria bacterium]|nr:[protein-PII] uridylyltransferase [Deltaproteobacteria bacterium]